jgi:hypothetical protein
VTDSDNTVAYYGTDKITAVTSFNKFYNTGPTAEFSALDVAARI